MAGDFMTVFTALGIVLVVPLSCQAFMYWKVVITGRDRNHIDGMALLVIGLVPIVGLAPLMETYNKDRRPFEQAESGSPSLRAEPPPENRVHTVQQRRDQLLIDPEQVIQDYLDDNNHLGDLGLDDLDSMDS